MGIDVKKIFKELVIPELREIKSDIKVIESRLNSIEREMNARFNAVDSRLNSLEKRFDTAIDIHERLAAVEARLGK